MADPARVRWAKLRIGAVTAVALVILGVLVYLLSGGTLFTPKVQLLLYIPDATGLAPDSPVRVDGIPIGSVESVGLSGTNDPKRIVRLVLRVPVDRLHSIPSDSTAQISVENFIGDRYVDITSGTSPTPVRAGGEIAYQNQTDFAKSLDLTQLEQQLRQVDAIITEIEEGRSPLGQFVLGDQFYRDLRHQFGDLQRGIHEAVSTGTTIGKVMYSDEALRRISAPLQDLDRTLAAIQSGQGAGQYLRDSGMHDALVAQFRDLRTTLTNLTASDFFRSDQTYTDWNRAVAGLIRSVDDINTQPVFTTTALYDNINGAAAEWTNTIRDFRQNPKKYLRLEKIF
jgi:phospholipid/cholesterol/gamma-HCH transport system substrate-binding protein